MSKVKNLKPKYFKVLLETGSVKKRNEKTVYVIGDWDKVLDIKDRHRKSTLLYASEISANEYYIAVGGVKRL